MGLINQRIEHRARHLRSRPEIVIDARFNEIGAAVGILVHLIAYRLRIVSGNDTACHKQPRPVQIGPVLLVAQRKPGCVISSKTVDGSDAVAGIQKQLPE